MVAMVGNTAKKAHNNITAIVAVFPLLFHLFLNSFYCPALSGVTIHLMTGSTLLHYPLTVILTLKPRNPALFNRRRPPPSHVISSNPLVLISSLQIRLYFSPQCCHHLSHSCSPPSLAFMFALISPFHVRPPSSLLSVVELGPKHVRHRDSRKSGGEDIIFHGMRDKRVKD